MNYIVGDFRGCRNIRLQSNIVYSQTSQLSKQRWSTNSNVHNAQKGNKSNKSDFLDEIGYLHFE